MLVYRHRGGLRSEVDQRTSETLLIGQQHQIGFGYLTHEKVIDTKSQTLFYHMIEIAPYLVAQRYYIQLGLYMMSVCAHGARHGSIVDAELEGRHIHHLAVFERLLERFAGYILDQGGGDVHLVGQSAVNFHHVRGKRASAYREIHTGDGAVRLAGFEALYHCGDGLGHFGHIADEAVAHAIGELFLFDCFNCERAGGFYLAYGSFYFRAAYLKGDN